jgi:acetolactate synthase-1/2/3 large subunit
MAGNQRVWASDVIASALREQGFPYICIVPGGSFRWMHDSIVNHLSNETPRIVLCLHEEHAVAIAQGYAQVTNEPLAVFTHANVGLMHATMAIFNAWCDRTPMLVLGSGGPVDAAIKTPWIDWIHSAADHGALVRNYTKWDDQPGSPAAAVDSIRRATMISRTWPQGPVFVNLDSGVQRQELEEEPKFFDAKLYCAPTETAPSPTDLDAALKLIAAAKSPLLLAGRVSRSERGWAERVKFAEAAGARVFTCYNIACSFPTDHALYRGTATLIMRPTHPTLDEMRKSDLVISLDWSDLGGTLAQAWPAGGKEPPPVISVSNDFHIHNGWSKDHEKPFPADVRIATTPDAFVSAILPKMNGAKRARVEPLPPFVLPEVKPSGDIGVADLASVFHRITANDKVSIITRPIGWPHGAIPCRHPHDFLGSNGGGGVGAGPGIAIGAALALREKSSERLPVAVIGDGDYMMGVNALWTAANAQIPVLIVVANNRAFFNDVVHQGNVAKQRGRPDESKWIGQRIDEPAPDLAGIARNMGLEGEGPITDLKDLEPALRRAVARLRAGAPFVLDVVVRAEYVGGQMG